MGLINAEEAREESESVRDDRDSEELNAISRVIKISIDKGSFSCYVGTCGLNSKKVLTDVGYSVEYIDGHQREANSYKITW